jgi:hypothetical protein
MDRERLGIYLNDHLAGAAAALQLLERLESAEAEPRFGTDMRGDHPDDAADRRVLESLIARIGAEPSAAKQIAGRIAERFSRLKIGSDSGPFPRFESLEMLALGILGKKALWRALASLDEAGLGTIDFAALEARADEQFARVERERLRLAPFAFCDAERAKEG